ncbi:WD repeat-containing protein 82 [Chytridiales sp. JEL 0842]|nr:WD repeat-containing protein 82 [Chytridiales sp. JEL 0842]
MADTAMTAPDPTPTLSKGIPLTDDRLQTFQLAKVFKDSTRHLSSLDFTPGGDLLLAVSEEGESMHLYDCLSGTIKKTSYSKKYGCSLGRFTHKKECIIHGSTKEDSEYAIRYLSFHDNKYLRYFKGHTGRVTGLEMSPLDDQFLSCSTDGTVRLWDLRGSNSQGVLQTGQERNAVSFDPTGLIFAVASGSSQIRLYDLKNYAAGPFITMTVPPVIAPNGSKLEWGNSIKFSNDGKYLLITTLGEPIIILDSFDGKMLQILRGRVNNTGLDLDANFTPDAKYVVSGSQDGGILFWDVVSGKQVVKLEGHREPPKVVMFNPRHMMLASGDSNLGFWIPSMTTTMKEG